MVQADFTGRNATHPLVDSSRACHRPPRLDAAFDARNAEPDGLVRRGVSGQPGNRRSTLARHRGHGVHSGGEMPRPPR